MNDSRGFRVDMVILAAGYSERMGVFKPMLPVGGVPAVLRCVNTARKAGVRETVIVTGHCADQLTAAFNAFPGEEGRTDGCSMTGENMDTACNAGAQRIILAYNERYAEGMLSSVLTGVSMLHSDSDAFFLLPADCCAVTAETLLNLINHLYTSESGTVIRPAFQGKRGHPPLIPSRYIEPLCAYTGSSGLKGFLSPLPSLVIETGEPGVLLDMDTPDDYASLLEHLRLPGFPDRAECGELLRRFNVSDEIIRHGEQVARLALKFAELLEERGVRLNTALLESACLLHDIARTEHDHARAGMKLLLTEGYPEAALLVGSHMDLPSEPEDINERELLYLADKLCRRGRIVRLEETSTELAAKYLPGSDPYIKAMARMASARTILNIMNIKYSISGRDYI